MITLIKSSTPIWIKLKMIVICHLVSVPCSALFSWTDYWWIYRKTLCKSPYLHHRANECTDLWQPMDLSVNKSAKSFFKNEFENWYAAQVCEELKNGSTGIEGWESTCHCPVWNRLWQNGSWSFTITCVQHQTYWNTDPFRSCGQDIKCLSQQCLTLINNISISWCYSFKGLSHIEGELYFGFYLYFVKISFA